MACDACQASCVDASPRATFKPGTGTRNVELDGSHRRRRSTQPPPRSEAGWRGAARELRSWLLAYETHRDAEPDNFHAGRGTRDEVDPRAAVAVGMTAEGKDISISQNLAVLQEMVETDVPSGAEPQPARDALFSSILKRTPRLDVPEPGFCPFPKH